MPATPKLRDAAAAVGVAEVLCEVEAEAASQTNRHVAVAREVKENLEREGEDAEPGTGGGEFLHRSVQELSRNFRELVGEDYLFAQADEKAENPFAQVCGGHVAVVDFSCHEVVAHNGTGNQLREHGDVEQQAAELLLHGCLTAINVNEIGNGLKRVETDADGKCDVGSGDGHADAGEGGGDEVRIFERTENRHVAAEACCESQPTVSVAVVDEQSCDVVHCHAAQHEEHIDWFAPGIEQQGEHNQCGVAPSRSADALRRSEVLGAHLVHSPRGYVNKEEGGEEYEKKE